MGMRSPFTHHAGRVAVSAAGPRLYRHGLVAVAVAALALVSAGCSVLYQAPEVRLTGVRLVGLGLTGGALEADVVVTNPNRYALRGSHLAWTLDLGDVGADDSESWSPLATGRLEHEIEVPAHDSTVVGLPIDFRWDGVGGAIRSLLERGTFDYRVSGELELRSPVRRTVPYRRTGTLSLGH